MCIIYQEYFETPEQCDARCQKLVNTNPGATWGQEPTHIEVRIPSKDRVIGIPAHKYILVTASA